MTRYLIYRCLIALLLAFGLFAFLFLYAGSYFWLWLALSVGLLCTVAFLAEPADMRAALGRDKIRADVKTLQLGLVSALALYAIFFAGNLAVRRIFPFGASEIESVYLQGAATPRWLVAIVLLFVVGPGEEIFWRGYVQRRLTAEFGSAGVLASVLAYTGVHLATGNLTLILAAFVCGFFWALLYRLYHSIWINTVSHGVWATAIFVLFPMMQPVTLF